jgi:metal transporter CNNM
MLLSFSYFLPQILHMGHSRILTFHNSKHNIKGLVLVKRLIVCNPADKRPLHHFVHRRPIVVGPDVGLYELLDKFQNGRSHMAVVTEHKRELEYAMETGEDVAGYVRVMGIVTLEDVVEEVLSAEIQDEMDGRQATTGFLSDDDSQEAKEYRHAAVVKCLYKLRDILHRVRRRIHERHNSVPDQVQYNGDTQLQMKYDL